MTRKIIAATVAAASVATGVALAVPVSASVPPPVTVSGNGSTQTHTSPQFALHAGGADVTTRAGSVKYTASHHGPVSWQDPYLTTGYNGGKRAGTALPVQLGKQGNPVASVSYTTTRDFWGDVGFDIWLTETPNKHSYAQMTDGGPGTTEIMIWFSSVGLPLPRTGYYANIDGMKFGTIVGLAAQGHAKSGTRAGWNNVNFILDAHKPGAFIHHGHLALNPFLEFAVKKGWVKPHDYIMAINNGAELTYGGMSVTGYSLTGLR